LQGQLAKEEKEVKEEEEMEEGVGRIDYVFFKEGDPK
jgi:hypothetical protein